MSDFFTHTSANANDLGPPHYSVGVSDRQSAVALYRVGGPMPHDIRPNDSIEFSLVSPILIRALMMLQPSRTYGSFVPPAMPHDIRPNDSIEFSLVSPILIRALMKPIYADSSTYRVFAAEGLYHREKNHRFPQTLPGRRLNIQCISMG